MSLLSLHYLPEPVDAEEVFDILRIDSNEDFIQFAEDEGLEGDGSSDSPFIIQGYTFESDKPGNSLFIGNTTVHFVITNSSFAYGTRKDAVWNRGAGLELYNVVNAHVDSNEFTNNRFGILVTGSSNNVVTNNYFENNTYGISLTNSPNNIAQNNMFDRGGFRLSGSRETYVSQQIEGNKIGDKDILYFNNVDMEWDHLSTDASQIIMANVSKAHVMDLELKGSNILLAFSSRIMIDNIEVRDNNEEGVNVRYSSHVNITNSLITNNRFGIRMIGSTFNSMDNNVLRGNLQDGIIADSGSHDNTISNNTLSMNGVVIHRSERNVIRDNRIFRSIGEGVKVLHNSYHNEIHGNALLYNNRAQDKFNASRIQARDETGQNSWNAPYPKGGNYWSDWTGPDNYSGSEQDEEGSDGIVDISYNLTGSDARDRYPLTKPPMPVISTSPRNLTIFPGNTSSQLKWDMPHYDGGSEIHSFLIYMGELLESQTLLSVVDANKTSFTDTGLINEKPYYYRVSAVNSVGESVSTKIVEGVPDGTPPELHIIEPHEDSYHNQRNITVRWNGTDLNSGIDFFEVRITGGEWIEVGQNTTYTFYNVTEGTNSVWVRAVDNAGNEETKRVIFTIDKTPPEVLSYEPVGDSVNVDANIRVVFSEPMNQEAVNVSMTNVTLIELQWLNETVLRLQVVDGLDFGKTYNIYVNGSDLAGNQLTTHSWYFSTKTGGVVVGRIVNQNGKEISGAKIALEHMETFSDNQGGFRIETYSGTHTAVLTKEGYEDKVVEIEVIAGEEVDIGEISMNQVKPSGYDLLLVIAAVIVVVTGIMALAIFIVHEKNKEVEFGEIEFEDEDTEELPPEFLE